MTLDTNQHKSSSVFSLKALNISRTGINRIVMKSEKLLKLLTAFGQADETQNMK